MAAKDSTYLSAERLRELLCYSKETGVFTRRISQGGKLAGSIAGNIRRDGYTGIVIDGRRYLAHRLAWIYVYGKSPTGEIDHIDGNRSNNRVSNLRDATRTENVHNRKSSNRNSKSGLIGVSWHKSSQQWVAQIKLNYRSYNLGLYKTKELAHAAYLEAKERMHKFGDHINHH